MTGRMTALQLFNTSIYDDSECRLSGRRSPSGTWEMYRLPAYVSSYAFRHESQHLKLRFRYSIYNSTLQALLDAKKSRSLSMDVHDDLKYEELFLNLKSAPLRYFSGAKPYYEAMEDLASHNRKTSADSAAPVLYSLRASATTGDFELKPKEQLHWRHLDERFRQRLRRAVVDDDFLKGFFDEVGTHYARGGTFGGVSERWWISRRRPERKCGSGEESKILDSGLMAACDRFRLGGDDEEDGAKDSAGKKIFLVDRHFTAVSFPLDANSTSVFSMVQSLATRCHLVFDDERFRTSRWTVTSGAPPERLKAAHTQQAAFSGRSNDVQLQQWLASLNDEPSTVRVDLAPICDLLSLVDERSWHMDRCHEQLIAYVKAKDPFYSGKGAKTCSSSDLPLKFEKLETAHADNGRALVEVRGHASGNVSAQVYCIPTSVYPPERTCRSAVSSAVRTSAWNGLVMCIAMWKVAF